jgi:hypothetical protein
LTSNFVTGLQNFTPFYASICPGETYTWGSQALSSPGVYIETYTGSTGCDSLVGLTLTVNPAPNTSVLPVGDSLFALQNGAFYQWLDCNAGFAAVSGETSQWFSPAVNGDYAVQLNFGGCFDTSTCYTISTLGLLENDLGTAVHIFPNPVNDRLNLELGNQASELSLSVSELSGKEVCKRNYSQVKNLDLDASGWAPGVYVLRLKTGVGEAAMRFVKK